MTRLCIALALAAAVLAGCDAGGPGEPARPAPIPTRTIPPATLSPATTLVSALPRFIGTDGDLQMFEVSARQRELVARNWHRVIVRQKLWDLGVRFGITDPAQPRQVVLINPGLSGLSARQILDRMLRDG